VDDEWSPLGATEVHYLHSAAGGEFKIFIGHCDGAADRDPQVLYLFDANGYFGGAVDLIRIMQLSRHLPPLLVVGIGYRAAILADTMERRTFDLTPSSYPYFAELFPEQSAMGGAASLLEFVEASLKPWVDHSYRVSSVDACYFGHSLGGLFGTWVLLHAPATFGAYVIGSPSLWWNDDQLLKEAQQMAVPLRPPPRAVYFGVGALETHQGRIREAARLPEPERSKSSDRYIDMAADTERMVDLIRQRIDGVDLYFDIFPNEFHITVPFLILSRGLRRVFGAPL
jgi:predicted alpha/beta superfamily hydrolase